MKEIGIEKLIELLNEFEQLNMCRKFKEYDIENQNMFENDFVFIKVSELISKRYGFIKWLVENDKIDLGLYREYMPNLGEDFSVESNIIMNLSIAIDPIGYLNYILK